jgi:hypothetical protein
MAKQRTYLLVGLPHTGLPMLTGALERHREVLAQGGLRLPAKSADEAFRAAVELRREHKAWGLRRRDVEGTWAGICRRVHKQRAATVVGHELLAGAASEEVALLVDGLAGTHVHLVVLAGVPDARLGLFPDELDLAGVTARWERAVTGPDRLHVVVTAPGDPRVAWRALGGLVGFDADRLALPEPAHVRPVADTAALRLIAESSGLDLPHEELVVVAEQWAKVVADRGYDVLGDLRDLVPVRPAAPTDPARAAYDDRVEVLTDALSEAVAELGRLRARLSLTEHRNAKLERKRRKLGRRLASVS